MDLHRLFEIQNALDTTIQRENGLLGKDLVQEKILALQVELGELANETRCFKFWSRKVPSPREVILEEFVDCLHFILSIGIDLGYTDIGLQPDVLHQSLTSQFQEIFKSIGNFAPLQHKDGYLRVFNQLMGLGSLLSFTWEEVNRAYLEKNKVNYQRQAEGY